MATFLVIFFSLYGGIHLFLYRRFTAAFPETGRRTRATLAILLFVGTVAPLLTRVAERGGMEQLARVVALPGYLWMSVAFLFFVLSILFTAVAPLLKRTTVERHRFTFPLGLATLLTFYGIFEAGNLTVERIRIESQKLPAGTARRIVFVSDIHLGLLTRERFVRDLTGLIRDQEPDMVISGGDLIDGYRSVGESHLSMLAQIRPPLGSFAIPGNHEYYVGIDEALAKTTRAGFTPLRGEIREAGEFVILGEDDRTGIRMGSYRPLQDNQAQGGFRILLRHQPFLGDAPPADLQLSGHVHKGQIFPFNLVTWLRFRVPAGLSRKPDATLLYVGRGTGTWGPPVRLLAPPEVTVITVSGPRP